MYQSRLLSLFAPFAKWKATPVKELLLLLGGISSTILCQIRKSTA
jgi:hypothetical protein